MHHWITLIHPKCPVISFSHLITQRIQMPSAQIDWNFISVLTFHPQINLIKKDHRILKERFYAEVQGRIIFEGEKLENGLLKA